MQRVAESLLRAKGLDVITEGFCTEPGTIGFRSRSTLDESPEARQKTRLAVARAKEGDHEALRYLYVSYSHNIYGYVRSIVRDDHAQLPQADTRFEADDQVIAMVPADEEMQLRHVFSEPH